MFGHKTKQGPTKREPLESLEDLRDDCIALYLNSGLTQRQIHERGGADPPDDQQVALQGDQVPEGRYDPGVLAGGRVGLDARPQGDVRSQPQLAGQRPHEHPGPEPQDARSQIALAVALANGHEAT